jgi:hypothetical protein
MAIISSVSPISRASSISIYQPIALVASWMSQERATCSEKVETFLDPLERRSWIFAAKGSALVGVEYSPPDNKNRCNRMGSVRPFRAC